VRRVFTILIPLLLTLPASLSLGEEDEEEKLKREIDEELEMHEDADYPDLVAADEESEFMEEILFLQEEDIVLTAAKHKQKKGFSPAAVVVITRKDIDESGAINLMELLRRYPAVHVYNFDPLYISAMIRGTIHVMLMIDGREVNVEFYPAPFFNVVPIGIHEIERIEIVLGPNSALYGANAVAAVINIGTRPPTDVLHADVSIGAGDYGTTMFEGLVGGSLGPLMLQGSFGIDRARSWMDRDSIPKDLMRANGSARLELPGGHLTLRGGMAKGAGRMYGVMGYMELDEILFAYAQADLKLGDMMVRAYWYPMRLEFSMGLNLIHPDTGVDLGTTPYFYLDGDTFQLDGQYDLQLFDTNLLIAGADFRFTSYRCDQTVDGEISEYRFGVFIHDEQRFGEKVVLTVGARFDWNSVTDPAVSPRAALVYNPSGDHFLRVSGGTAFRKPSLVETSTNFRMETTFPEVTELFETRGISNPNLDNEILNAVEIGYRGAVLEKALRFGVDAYLNMSRNWIFFQADINFRPPPFNMQIDVNNSNIGYTNTGEDDSNILGVNAFVAGEPVKQLTLFLRGEWRYEYEIETDDEVHKTINLNAVGGFVLRLPLGFTFSLAMVYSGSRKDDVSDPVSFLSPYIWSDIPDHLYALSAVYCRLKLGPSRLDLGLTMFNPFGRRFREKLGIRAPNGSNYGGELIGTRAMLTARFQY
jgi:outer membrane cobalamin receptor